MMPQAPDQTSVERSEAEDLLPHQGGKRAEVIQRLQIGVFGLAAMVLIVALANVIMERAKLTEATAVPEAASTTAPMTSSSGSLSDPLVDAGVVPDMPSSSKKNAAPNGAPVSSDARRSPSQP